MGSRVLIVDDHPGFRRFARSLLQAEGVDVVGEAEDEASAVEAVARLRPDVVLLDVLLPGRNGFERRSPARGWSRDWRRGGCARRRGWAR